MRDRINERVKVEGRQVRILGLDEDHGGRVVPGEVHVEGQAVVEVGEGNAVLSADRLADDDLVNVIELIPILFPATTEWKRDTNSTLGKFSLSHSHDLD